jgi:hypothetical protein
MQTMMDGLKLLRKGTGQGGNNVNKLIKVKKTSQFHIPLHIQLKKNPASSQLSSQQRGVSSQVSNLEDGQLPINRDQ